MTGSSRLIVEYAGSWALVAAGARSERPGLLRSFHQRGGAGQPARHPARLTDLTTAGESLHAPVCAGMEDARTGAKPRLSHRDLCRRPRDPVQEGKAEEALLHLRTLMGKLKLTVNEEKTRICKVPEGEFNFLGYSFGRMYSE